MRILVALLASAMLAGCVAPLVLLRNDKGEIVRCEANAGAAMMGGYIGSKASVDACVEAYEKVGYRRIQ